MKTAEKAEISIMLINLEKEEDLFALEPEEIVKLLEEYFDMIVNIIYKFNGILIRFIADEVFVIFRDKEHQKLACDSCIEIINRFESWRKTSSLMEKSPSLRIAIGINTGEAIILTGKNFYEVWGESVNIAIKLRRECLNYEKENLISEFTYQAIKGIIPAEKVNDISIKDRQIGIYQLLIVK